jgi:hypothetical protein
MGKARDHVRLNEGRVKPLIRDAIAVEDHPVAIFQLKLALRHRRRGQGQRGHQQNHNTP